MASKSKKIYIGKSKLHGRGIFVSRDIKKGGRIMTLVGKEVKHLIVSPTVAKRISVNIMGVGKNKWIDPQKREWVFFNHSCNPNTAIKNQIQVTALRNIKKDEEITFDYSTTEADIFWSMKCYCKEKNCRKTIKSIKFLPSNVFKKYSENISKYYKMIYIRFNRRKFKSLVELRKAWVLFLLN